MRLPIILSEDGDIKLYKSVEDMQADIESIDVHNGIYEAYDASGEMLILSTSRSSEAPRYKENFFDAFLRFCNISWWNEDGWNEIHVKPSGEDRSVVVKELLLKALKRTEHYEDGDDEKSLQDIIDKWLSIFREPL